MRRLEEYQLVFDLKRVWNHFSGSGSLWVALLHSNVFNRKSYWTTPDAQRFSPTVRSMLRQKELVAVFLRCNVGDGRSASFWHDFWNDMGPLISALGETGPRDLRLRLEARVCDAVANGFWALPNARSDEAETLQIVLTTMSPPSIERGPDTYLWRNGVGHFVLKFSVKSTWDSVRESAPVVTWHSLIWFKEAVPRCSFVSWMASLARLPTKYRLNEWGIHVPLQCVLCSSGIESHQHLFFQCSFVEALWLHYCGNFGLSVPSSINAVASLLSLPLVVATPGLRVVLKLLLQVVVYCTWRERNVRVFQQVSTSVAALELIFIASFETVSSLLNLHLQPQPYCKCISLFFPLVCSVFIFALCPVVFLSSCSVLCFLCSSFF